MVAGVLKLMDLGQAVIAVRAYHILPYDWTLPVAYALPIIEVAIGLLLLVGIGIRGAALISTLLMAVFIGGIISVWVRGIAIDCGCFGGGGENPNAFAEYPWEIARDLAIGLASFFLVLKNKTKLALVNLLEVPEIPTASRIPTNTEDES